MPPAFPVFVSVMLGILSTKCSDAPLLFWWAFLGTSLIFAIVRQLRPWPFFLAFLCLAAMRCQLAPHLPHQNEKLRKPGKIQVLLEKNLSKSLSYPYNTIAEGIILGDHKKIPDEILNDFRTTGTYHVLVASGLKVAFVAGGAWFLFSYCPYYFRILASAFAVLLYAFAIGGDPPILRASIMGICGFLTLFIGRAKDSLNIFFLTGLILLLIYPTWLFDAGFQLSFLSVLGILFFYEKISKKLGFLPKLAADSVSVTLSAMLPIIIPLAYYFHNLSFVSPLANIPVVVLTLFSMVLGTGGFVAHFAWKPLGHAISFWHQVVLVIMLWIVRFCSRLPFAYIWVRSPGPLTAVLFYSLLTGLLFMLTKQSRGKILFFTSLALLIALWGIHDLLKKPPEITFLNVGQGDCTIISIKGKIFLVDSGGSSTELDKDGYSVGRRIVVPALQSHGINKIEGILLTHPHRDHVGGLIAVIEHFPVKRIWLPNLKDRAFVYKTFLKEASLKRVPLIFVHGNEKIHLAGEAWLHIYWPVPPLLHDTISDLNNNSVVCRLVINHVKILLSGDVETEGENSLLGHLHPKSLLWSQILKVPHHGSATSSTSDFLKAVSPVIAVVSVGKHNPYHQPSRQTLERLRKKGAKVFRTDQDGTIDFEIESAGLHPWIKKIP